MLMSAMASASATRLLNLFICSSSLCSVPKNSFSPLSYKETQHGPFTATRLNLMGKLFPRPIGRERVFGLEERLERLASECKLETERTPSMTVSVSAPASLMEET
jgi:hypothetical protein